MRGRGSNSVRRWTTIYPVASPCPTLGSPLVSPGLARWDVCRPISASESSASARRANLAVTSIRFGEVA
jgi:hypothetical protein